MLTFPFRNLKFLQFSGGILDSCRRNTPQALNKISRANYSFVFAFKAHIDFRRTIFSSQLCPSWDASKISCSTLAIAQLIIRVKLHLPKPKRTKFSRGQKSHTCEKEGLGGRGEGLRGAKGAQKYITLIRTLFGAICRKRRKRRKRRKHRKRRKCRKCRKHRKRRKHRQHFSLLLLLSAPISMKAQ